MQQRFWPYSSRVPDEELCLVAPQQQPQLKHHHLPACYGSRSAVGKKEASSRLMSVEKWVHLIPAVVVFCIFMLWWFSVSVKVVSIDGKVAAIRETEIPLPLNETRIDFTILAAASVPQNLEVKNVTEVPSGEQK